MKQSRVKHKGVALGLHWATDALQGKHCSTAGTESGPTLIAVRSGPAQPGRSMRLRPAANDHSEVVDRTQEFTRAWQHSSTQQAYARCLCSSSCA